MNTINIAVGLDATDVIYAMKYANTWVFSAFLGLKKTSNLEIPIDLVVIHFVFVRPSRSDMLKTYLTIRSVETVMTGK